MTVKKILSNIGILPLGLGIGFSTSHAQTETYFAPVVYLVDSPTAGFFPSGTFSLGLRMEPEGGILGGITVQLTDPFLMGVSYGGSRIIGSGEVDWNPRVEFEGRARIFQETLLIPSIALGFTSQGYDGRIGDEGRYRIKSKGFYAVTTKGFNLLGHLGLHGGVNKTLEGNDKDFSFFFGMDKGLGESFSVVGEYDLAMNDDEKTSEKIGLINLGVRWNYMGTLFFEFDFRNLVEHRGFKENRVVKIEYMEFF